MYWVVC